MTNIHSKKRRAITAIAATALAASFVLIAPSAANAWGSRSGDAGPGCIEGKTFIGSSTPAKDKQSAHVSTAAPWGVECPWGGNKTGYTRIRLSAGGLSGTNSCVGSGCAYTGFTWFGPTSKWWGGLHYFNTRSFST